ncbi:MAG TPA: response regulator [Phycisphaerae bacterium]|nr:response regulator [Phycisphaerae bacterium]
MKKRKPTVSVVDDDEALCEGLRWLLESEALNVETHTSAEAFLDAYDPDCPGCLVLDVRMGGMSGLELQAKLAEQELSVPVIVLTGHADVPMAVQATKAGAVEFLQKPVDDQVLLDCIHRAIELDAQVRERQAADAEFAARIELLTPRQREVLDLVVAGKANKQIAAGFGVSPRTVEVHRKRIMRKLRVKSSVDLVRNVMALRAPQPRL